MADNKVVYEQPANELTRVILRLEFLFQRLEHALAVGTVWDSRNAIEHILDVLAILDRPDLKTRLTKELQRYLNIFSRIPEHDDVDSESLGSIKLCLRNLIHRMAQIPGKLGQTLREHEFIGYLYQQRGQVGGICSMDSAEYQHWLHLSAEQRHHDLSKWFESLSLAHSIVKVLLNIIRESNIPTQRVAQIGFYQTSIEARALCQLVQVILPNQCHVFPRISVGKHRVGINFYVYSPNGQSTKATEDIAFELMYCII